MTSHPPALPVRPHQWILAALVLAVGAWLRFYFLTSHGSWDTEYWKALATESTEGGLAQVYGGPGSVPPGEFMAQLTAAKPRYEVTFRGRDYVIDYPPLAIAAWGSSWRFFTSKPRPYRGDEAENLAVKFPPVFGDTLAVLVLLWAFRSAPRTGLWLACLYWIFPTTWVSSAVLGFFDGYAAPFLLVSLLLATPAPFLGGAAFALACLTKLTAAIALPALFLAAGLAQWRKVAAGGILATALIALPFGMAGTLDAAFIHIARVFSQDRVSGGYANPWWLIGHAAQVLRDKAEWSDPIDYVRRDSFVAPLGLIGFAAAGLAAAWILWTARRVRSPRAIVYVTSLLFLAWTAFTMGVHDNHNHPVFLLLVATGLGTWFLRFFFFATATSTMLGSVALHGFGRYYGPQWRPVLPFADNVARLRMAAGFDDTLVLSVVNTALLLVALVRLAPTLRDLDETSAN